MVVVQHTLKAASFDLRFRFHEKTPVLSGRSQRQVFLADSLFQDTDVEQAEQGSRKPASEKRRIEWDFNQDDQIIRMLDPAVGSVSDEGRAGQDQDPGVPEAPQGSNAPVAQGLERDGDGG